MFHYGQHQLTRQLAIALADGTTKGILPPPSRSAVLSSRRAVERMATGTRAVYGINTGFGPLCDVQISPEETNLLQRNLLLSHAAWVGPSLRGSLAS